jgi:2-polyprenyl-6-methoxyphenol hydroxylase-like FAD-dependent oxidoreductase
MPTALIVGAGIGGLAAGIALRRAGWDVRIFERAPAPRDVGFALGLAPNAMAALRELGVADAVAAHGMTPTSAEIRRPDGRVLRRLVARGEGLPSGDLPKLILRPALHAALLQALGSSSGRAPVEVNRAAVRFAADGRAVQVVLADGTSAAGDLLIGADGVASTIRAQLHPEEAAARPSGYFAVRGLSRAVERLNGLQALWYLGRGVESGVIQAGRNEIYWFISLLADEVNAGPPDVRSVMRRCTSGFDAQFHAITGATAPADMRLDELFVREPLARWGTGPVSLLGDAAHPMLPHTGQGAAQALEDAVLLGRALGRGGDHLDALRRYEAVRARRTQRVVKMGPRLARITTTRNPVVVFLRDTTIRLVPERAIVKAFTRTGPDPHRELDTS